MGAFGVGVEDRTRPYVWTVRGKDFAEYDGPIDGYLAATIDWLDGGVGSWSLTLKYDDPNVALLTQPGFGVVMRLPGSTVVVASGRVQLPKVSIAREGNGVTFTGPLDEFEAASDVAAPSPTEEFTTGLNADATHKDTRIGPAETVWLAFLKANIGSTAFHNVSYDRRRAYLLIPASAGRGTSGTWQADFTPLLELGQSITGQDQGITYRIKQREAADGLEVVVRARADVSDLVVFSQADGSLDEASYGTQAPLLTFALAVDSDDTTRTVAYYSDLVAEAKWGFRFAGTVSGSSSSQGSPYDSARSAVLDGAEAFTAELSPVVLPDAPQPFVDYFLGDTVTVVQLDGTPILQRLTGLSYTHEGGDQQKAPVITPAVGPAPFVRHDPVSYTVQALTPVIAKLKRKKG